ncbi:uncharacterized protein LOC132708410 isoform X2 [Cylas formicarius]|uniref:uncharacterized protein LOC132708410 isoform X2 n=1 Tax=Cylas formicarius TaxID=197179 RepID=UPI0029589438|nr:uncharacterized protein LOC132708410 isoform X2 [Cylas formicarius]
MCESSYIMVVPLRTESLKSTFWNSDEFAKDLYAYHPSASIYKKTNQYLQFPKGDVSMIDAARQQEVEDFYILSQLHRDHYKDHTDTVHPVDYFRTGTNLYQCLTDPTSAYLQCPEFYTQYKHPIVLPLTLERSYKTSSLPKRALTGVYNRSSVFIRS